MACKAFTVEAYELYALGALEEPEAAEMRAHLNSGCDLCRRGVAKSRAFWPSFAASQASDSADRPSARLRENILAAVQPAPAPSRWPAWLWPAASVALIVLAFSSGWFLRRGEVEQAGYRTAVQQQDLQRLREQNDRLEQQLRQSPNPAPVVDKTNPIAKTNPAGVDPAVVSSLRSELETTKALAAEASAALKDAQARRQQLESDLQQQRNQLAAVVREKDDLQGKFASASAETQRLRDREKQLATLNARLQDMDREKSQLEAAVARQQQQLAQNMRLATLMSSPDVRVVHLRGTESASSARGNALVVEGSKVVFYGTNLPDLPAGRVYQLWVMRGSSPAIASAGVFRAPKSQMATIEFSDRNLISNITGFAVTEEPEGGSPLPTGHKVLVGTSKS